MTDLSLAQFAVVVANLYRDEPDECVITIGDWQPSPVEGRPEIFHGTIKANVGDFRRWSRSAGQ